MILGSRDSETIRGDVINRSYLLSRNSYFLNLPPSHSPLTAERKNPQSYEPVNVWGKNSNVRFVKLPAKHAERQALVDSGS